MDLKKINKGYSDFRLAIQDQKVDDAKMYEDFTSKVKSEEMASRLPNERRELALRTVVGVAYLILSVALPVFGWSLIPLALGAYSLNSARKQRSLIIEMENKIIERIKRSMIKDSRAKDFEVIGYFVNWAMYSRRQEQYASEIRADLYSGINYAFFFTNADGSIELSDPWSDVQVGTDWNDPDKYPYWGNLRMLNNVKEEARKRGLPFKTAISTGGWNDRVIRGQPIAVAARTEETRKRFAKSAREMCVKYGFDRFDIDWEYPADETEGPENFIKLLRACREEFDAHGLELSIAVPAGHAKDPIDWNEVNRYVDLVQLMTYDYHGHWDTYTGHLSPLNPTRGRDDDPTFNIRSTVDFYTQYIDKKKLVLGLPVYYRTFAGVEPGDNPQLPGLYQPFTGPGSADNPTEAVKDWATIQKELDDPNCATKLYYDEEAKASYTYNSQTKELATGCDTRMLRELTEYAMDQGLGGVMVWELDGDKRPEYTASEAINDAITKRARRGDMKVPPPPYESLQDISRPYSRENEAIVERARRDMKVPPPAYQSR